MVSPRATSLSPTPQAQGPQRVHVHHIASRLDRGASLAARPGTGAASLACAVGGRCGHARAAAAGCCRGRRFSTARLLQPGQCIRVHHEAGQVVGRQGSAAGSRHVAPHGANARDRRFAAPWLLPGSAAAPGACAPVCGGNGAPSSAPQRTPGASAPGPAKRSTKPCKALAAGACLGPAPAGPVVPSVSRPARRPASEDAGRAIQAAVAAHGRQAVRVRRHQALQAPLQPLPQRAPVRQGAPGQCLQRQKAHRAWGAPHPGRAIGPRWPTHPASGHPSGASASTCAAPCSNARPSAGAARGVGNPLVFSHGV